MSRPAVVGVDIGTSSSKGVLVGTDGNVIASATREHQVDRPFPGHVEMDAEIWWTEFAAIVRELVASSDVEVTAVGVSGMGPCALVTDADGVPLRPAILYGVDTRATPRSSVSPSNSVAPTPSANGADRRSPLRPSGRNWRGWPRMSRMSPRPPAGCSCPVRGSGSG